MESGGGLSIKDVVVIDVHHAPSDMVITGALSSDHSPYMIDLCTDDVLVMRVFRSFAHLTALHQNLESSGLSVTGFPLPKRFHFGGLFGMKFADSDEGKERRRLLAHYLNKVWKQCQSEPAHRDIVLQWLDGAHSRRVLDCVHYTRESLERWRAPTPAAFPIVTSTSTPLFSAAAAAAAPRRPFVLHGNDWAEYGSGLTMVHAACARAGSPGSHQVLKMLLESGADAHALSLTPSTPVQHLLGCVHAKLLAAEKRAEAQAAAAADDGEEATGAERKDEREAEDGEGKTSEAEEAAVDVFDSEEAYQCVQVLIEAGVDIAEAVEMGNSLAHVCARSYPVMTLIANIAPRVFSLQNGHGETPADTALGSPDVSSLLYDKGAVHGKEVAEVARIIREESDKLDGFLALACESGDVAAQVHVLTQLADLYLIHQPIESCRLYVKGLSVARHGEGLETEVDLLYSKLVDVMQRICAVYQVEAKPMDAYEFGEALKRREREVRDLRANFRSLGRHQTVRERQRYLTDKVVAVLRSVMEAAVGAVATPPPCAFCFVLLGDVARCHSSPTSTVEYGLIVERASGWILEYFRAVCELFRARVIALHESKCQRVAHHTLASDPTPLGLTLDHLSSCLPFRAEKGGVLRLADTPVRLASLQESSYSSLASSLSQALLFPHYLFGDEHLLTAYFGELSRTFDRRQDTSTIELRHTRALSLIASAVLRFKNSHSQNDPKANVLSLQPFIEAPETVLRALAIFFNAPTQGSVWEVADQLVTAAHLSYGWAQGVKAALSTLIGLSLKAGGARTVRVCEERIRAERCAEGAARERSDDQEEEDEEAAAAEEEEEEEEAASEAEAAVHAERVKEVEEEVERGEASGLVQGGASDEDEDEASVPGVDDGRAFESSMADMLLGSDDEEVAEEEALRREEEEPEKAPRDPMESLAEVPHVSDEANEFALARRLQQEEEEEEARRRLAEESAGGAMRTASSASVGRRGAEHVEVGAEDAAAVVDALCVLLPFMELAARFDGENHSLFVADPPSRSSRLVAQAHARILMPRCALEEYKKAIDEGRPDAALMLEIGSMVMAASRHTDALIYLQRAVDMKKSDGERDPKLATALASLSVAHHQVGDLQAAIAAMEEAVLVDTEIYGEGHWHVSQDLRHLAKLHAQNGNVEAGLSSLERSMAGVVASRSASVHQQAQALAEAGLIYQQLRHYDQALAAFQRSLVLERQHQTGGASDRLAARHSSIGECLVKLRRRPEALEHFVQCRQLVEMTFGEVHPRTGACLFNLGLVCLLLERLEESRSFLRASLETYDAVGGAEHEEAVQDVKRVLEVCEQALAEREKGVEAYEAWKRMLAEERRRRERDLSSKTVWELQSDGKEAKEVEVKVSAQVVTSAVLPKVFSSGQIGKGQMDVIDDDFFDL